jgi:hypothetical protein
MLRQQQSYTSLKVQHPFHQQDNIQLPCNLIFSIFQFLHFLPTLTATKEVNHLKKDVLEILENVKRGRVDFLTARIKVKLTSDADVVTKFIVSLQEKDEAQDRANEPAHVGEELIYFLISSSVLDLRCGFFDGDRSINTARVGVDQVSKWIGRIDPLFLLKVRERTETLISFDRIVTYLKLSSGCEVFCEVEVASVIDVECLIAVDGRRVDLSGHNEEIKLEFSQASLQNIYSRIAHAIGV